MSTASMRSLRRAIALTAAVTGLFSWVGAAPAVATTPPANDAFAAASPLIGNADSRNFQSNVDATVEPGEPLRAGKAGGSSIWYQWVAPQDGVLSVNTFNSGLDTLLAMYTGDRVDALTAVASNDDAPNSFQSDLHASVQAGVRYFIAVDGFGAKQGPITVTWRLLQPPVNDDFAAARELTGLSGRVNGDMHDSTVEAGEPNRWFCSYCSQQPQSVWYRWTAPITGTADFQAVTSYGINFEVYTGSSVASLAAVTHLPGEDAQHFSAHVVGGTTYFVQLVNEYAYYYSPTFTLSFLDAAQPSNDNFADAVELLGDQGSATGTTAGATAEPGEPTNSGGPDHTIWYRWRAPENGTVRFDTFGSTFATFMQAWQGTQVDGLVPASDGNVHAVGTLQSRIRFPVVQGATYAIQIDGNREYDAPFVGDVALHWMLNPPRNDDVAQALEITGTRFNDEVTTERASVEPFEPRHAGASLGHSVWYHLRVNMGSTVVVSTRGSSFDTVLAVYRGDYYAYASGWNRLDSLERVTSNDDAGPRTSTSRVLFQARPYVDYFIAVDGRNDAVGQATLTADIVPVGVCPIPLIGVCVS